MVEAVLLAGGFVLGVAVGRWWALLPAVALGAWIAAATHVDEVPHWFLGLGYTVISGVGIAAGVGLRHRMRADRSPRS